MSKFSKFLDLNHREKKLLFWLFWASVKIHHSLRFMGYEKTLERLKKSLPPKNDYTHITPIELGRLVNAATYTILNKEKACLRSSVLLWWLLNNNQVNAILCKGLRFEKQNLEGHAWVEVDGLAINDRKYIAKRYDNITREYWSK